MEIHAPIYFLILPTPSPQVLLHPLALWFSEHIGQPSLFSLQFCGGSKRIVILADSGADPFLLQVTVTL